ncbi:LysR family transcriptional regulator [Sphingomonas sp. SUN039]|uniref:LysR family transcriptional regulator n=1 Tax=Sphingomonas sp. SUN039 TaxID=2937787 RepID=UPI002164AE4D|nr:LysR family transcriptional regulator [Sphingomonas sp. SUN039]UVO55676.1 LysR family transcriptional regulator [Sphingomonas sp. SUN039]
MFELIQLRCFVAVAEELHFGRAAGRLNMTQPPLSRHIQVLERILRVELFRRSSRSVKLTAAGAAFLAEATRIVEMTDSAVATARAAAEGQLGMVTLGFTAASGYSFLPRLIGRVQAELPDVRFLLKEMVTGEQLESLLSGRIDFGLLRPPVRRPELESRRVLRERFIVCSHSSVPAADRPRRLADFDGLPLIMYAPDKARYFHDLITGLLASARAEPRLVQYLAQIHSILMLVGAGQGFALVPESSARLHPEDVVFSELEDADPIVELHAAWRRENDNPALGELLRHLDAVNG